MKRIFAIAILILGLGSCKKSEKQPEETPATTNNNTNPQIEYKEYFISGGILNTTVGNNAKLFGTITIYNKAESSVIYNLVTDTVTYQNNIGSTGINFSKSFKYDKTKHLMFKCDITAKKNGVNYTTGNSMINISTDPTVLYLKNFNPTLKVDTFYVLN
jgi:hypothetical protein